jgi:hypothetical protein
VIRSGDPESGGPEPEPPSTTSLTGDGPLDASTAAPPAPGAAWQAHVTCVDLAEPLCRVAHCRAALPPRRTAFCSDRHAREFERNHVWLHARRAARRRAGYACERCRFKPSEIRRDREARRAYPRHELRLEVNHIEPLGGAYRSVSCRNHQANLEVLCHRCHLAVTSAQRESRLTVVAR